RGAISPWNRAASDFSACGYRRETLTAMLWPGGDVELTVGELGSQWAVPKFSRSAVDRAGELLRTGIGDFAEAVEVVSNWRASHRYPLNILQMPLRRTVAPAK